MLFSTTKVERSNSKFSEICGLGGLALGHKSQRSNELSKTLLWIIFRVIVNDYFWFQDYHWWWRSFLMSGACSLYVFFYSIYYFVTKVRLLFLSVYHLLQMAYCLHRCKVNGKLRQKKLYCFR